MNKGKPGEKRPSKRAGAQKTAQDKPPELPFDCNTSEKEGVFDPKSVHEAASPYLIANSQDLTEGLHRADSHGKKAAARWRISAKTRHVASTVFGENPFDPYSDEISNPSDGAEPSGGESNGSGQDTTAQTHRRPSEIVGSPSTSQLRQQVRDLCPPVPGVYGMFDRKGDLIYIGKSRSLRHRLMSYFGQAAAKEKGGRIIENARAIQWETQPSDFAAQLREIELIRKWTPRFNVQGVPDRQRPVYLCLGRKPAETFFLSTDPPTSDCLAAEGPFYGMGRMRQVVESLNKTFGLRDCSQKTVFQFAEQLSLFDNAPRAGCLRLEIGTCMGPCAAACSRAEYLQRVNQAESFLDGFNDEPIQTTQEIMESAAANHQYELAARARDTLKCLAYAQRKLTHLGDARQNYSFIYAATGYDGRSIWYLIRSGEIIDVTAAPANADDYRNLKPLLQHWSGRLSDRNRRLALDHPHTVSIVASWFRKHRSELKKTFAPAVAGYRYHRLPRHTIARAENSPKNSTQTT